MKQPKLWRHQARAIQKVRTALETHNRAQCIMACGTGKTRVQMEVAASLVGERKNALLIVQVPTRLLIRQTWRAWQSGARFAYTALAVCSADDEKKTRDSGADDEVQELRPSTDPEAIAKFARKRGVKVIFTTYASSWRLESLKPLAVIYDEAHRVAGPKDRQWSVSLQDGFFASKPKRVFFTATPRLARDDAKSETWSMDDESTFGPEAFRFTFAEAVAAGVIVDFQIVVYATTEDKIRKAMEESPHDWAAVAGHDALKKARRRHGARQAIVYLSSISRAQEYTEKDRSAHLVTGAMRAAERHSILERFKSHEIETLANVRVLVEGYDMPTADTVVFAEPRSSVVEVVQALGRVMRIAPGKDRATVVLPVIVDDDGEVSSKRFRHLLQTIKALGAHDEALGQEIRTRAQAVAEKREKDDDADSRVKFTGVSANALRAVATRVLKSRASHQIDWDAVPLGKKSDHKIGRDLGVSQGMVRNARIARGIPTHRINWGKVGLGTKPDSALAAELGCNQETIRKQRTSRGVPAFRRLGRIDWRNLPLGEKPDAAIAKQIGCSQWAVTEARRRLGVPSHQERCSPDWEAIVPLLGAATDREVSERVGLSREAISSRRRRLGIPPYKPSGEEPEE